MEEMGVLVARTGLEWDSEVIAQCVDEDDYSFVEALGVPAAAVEEARGVCGIEIDRGDGAFGTMGEDESGEEEAGAEEVYG